MSKKMAALEAAMRKHALSFPEVVEEFPWGHSAMKVRNKTFVFLGGHLESAGKFSMTVKLPTSAEMATTLDYVEPAGYGLGRSGWVTVKCAAKDKPDAAMLRDWIDQSYRAIAPKALAKALG
ncbi:MAG: MmcQ/YjbR family DNA-binding protein [Pseudomonadota bacterium]